MLIFLHGFLGSTSDWDEVLSYLPKSLKTLRINLPGHGGVPFTPALPRLPKAKLLIGYSAGGRIALELKEERPDAFEKLLLFSSHPGVKSDEERKHILEKEERWIQLLQEGEVEDFLKLWYAQPLFESLKENSALFAHVLELRKKQNKEDLIAFLRTFSKAKRPLPKLFASTTFVYGSKDISYGSFYRSLPKEINVIGIKNAGHALLLESPKECAKAIINSL